MRYPVPFNTPFIHFLDQVPVCVISIRESVIFKQAIGGIVDLTGSEMRGGAVADGVVREALRGVRGLRMRGVSEAVQRMVDGLELLSDIGNQGTSVNKRLDPRPSTGGR